MQAPFGAKKALVHSFEKTDSWDQSRPLKQCSCKQHSQESLEKHKSISKIQPCCCTWSKLEQAMDFFAMEGVSARLPSINPNLLLAPKALYIDLAQLV